MPDLIPFITRQLGSETVNTVNARDLHTYLGMTQRYADWIKVQIRRAHLIENTDYIVFPIDGNNPQGGRPQVDHHLTFDAAKHVAMMSSAEKGHEVRAWFIAKEKELAALHTYPSAVDRFPELQAIIQLVQSTAEAKLLAEKAQHTAEEANAKARLALHGQQWVTIRQYVSIYQLERQVPRRLQQDYGRYLTGLCQQRGTPVYLHRVVEGWEEHTYPTTVIQETLGPWIGRRGGDQGTLHIVQD